MRQIIPLEPNDEIATIRAKIENAEFSQAVLVTPRDCSALMSDGGMSLVRRAADDAGIEIAIVTRAEEMRARAARFGLPTYNSIHQAQRDQWRMQSLARGFGATIAPAPELDPRALAPNVLTRVMQNRNALAFVGAAIFFLLLAACLLIPAARVRLVPSPIALTIATDALADPTISQINSAERWIPARKISREISGAAQLKTTTQKSVPDARASGSVIFTNLRNEDTVIPQGAIVKTSGGVPIRFSVTTIVTVPSGIGNRVEAPISALDPGPSGNVKELAINAIEGSLSFESRVINLKATTLGNVRNVRVVTMDDKKKLEAQLTAQLLQQGSATLTSVLKEGEFILPDTIVIDAYDTTFDRAVDEPADILNLKISGYAIGLAADREDLDALLRALAQRDLQSGYELLSNGVKADALPGGKYQYPAFRFPLRGVGYATPQIDNAKVARALQGKTKSDAELFLDNSLPLAQPPEISILPPGWFVMPWLNFRIAVFVDPQAVSAQ